MPPGPTAYSHNNNIFHTFPLQGSRRKAELRELHLNVHRRDSNARFHHHLTTFYEPTASVLHSSILLKMEAQQQQSSTMHSITIPKYSTPANYDLTQLPPPTITDPKDILIRVHAASINPIDVKKASGVSKAVLKDKYHRPHPITHNRLKKRDS